MPIKRKWKIRVFICYAGMDGYDLAVKIQEILKKHDYNTWLYNHNRVVGAIAWDDIAYAIKRKTDIFLYLCTQKSFISRGQSFESEYAMRTNHLMPVIICIDNSKITGKLSIFNAEHFNAKGFVKEFDVFATKIKNILLYTKSLPKSKKAKRLTRISK